MGNPNDGDGYVGLEVPIKVGSSCLWFAIIYKPTIIFRDIPKFL